MVDCVDRITLQLTEWLLEPLQRLRNQDTPSAVTVRPPGRRRRVVVHIAKSWPDGPSEAPRYGWSAGEAADPIGDPPPDLTWTDPATYSDPEDAYWAAADAIASGHRP